MKSKSYSYLFVFILISGLLSFCGPQEKPVIKEWTRGEVETEFESEHERLSELFKGGEENAEEMAELFGEYGILWTGKGEMIYGLENVVKYWKDVMGSEVTEVTFVTEYVFVKNEVLVIDGEEYDCFAFDIGKYHLIVEKKEGERKNQELRFLRGRRHRFDCTWR